MTILTDAPIRSSVISDCSQYRYLYAEEWGAGTRSITWVMLNPPEAGTEDQTIDHVGEFSRLWGYDRMAVVNLFALRAAHRDLSWAEDPVGPKKPVVRAPGGHQRRSSSSSPGVTRSATSVRGQDARRSRRPAPSQRRDALFRSDHSRQSASSRPDPGLDDPGRLARPVELQGCRPQAVTPHAVGSFGGVTPAICSVI